MKTSTTAGFSFVEVVLALALVAGSLVTLMALVPVGLKASREANRRTITGHILEDVHERLEGNPLRDGPLETGPIYYDDEGVFVDEGAAPDRINRRMFRIDVRIEKPASEALSRNAPGLKAVVIEIGWPVNPNSGELMGVATSRTRATVSYFVTTLTGPNWEKIDSHFDPLIEY
jgi:uncharacterized protein (TIGR02598 family)